MDILSIAQKFLPQDQQETIRKLLPYLKEQEVINDLSVILTELKKELEKAGKSATLDKSLKNIFNKAADLTDIAKDYIRTGDVSFFTVAKLAANIGAYQEGYKTLSHAFRARQPAMVALTQSVKDNKSLYDAVVRLATHCDGRLFKTTAQPDGSGQVTELLTGKNLSLRIEPKDFAEIARALSAGKNKPPMAPPAA